MEASSAEPGSAQAEPSARQSRRNDMGALRRRWVPVAALGWALLLAGCAQHQPAVGGSGPPTLSPTGTRVIDEHANGATLTVQQGQRFSVVLGAPDEAGSTYWRFDPPDGLTLAAVGPPVVRATPPGSSSLCRVPGLGCGTVTLTLQAAAPGLSPITAHRTTCGEAILCPRSQRVFRVTIRVLG